MLEKTRKISTGPELDAWLKRMNLSTSAAGRVLGRGRATIIRYVQERSPIPEIVARQAELIEISRYGRPFGLQERRPQKRLGAFQ